MLRCRLLGPAFAALFLAAPASAEDVHLRHDYLTREDGVTARFARLQRDMATAVTVVSEYGGGIISVDQRDGIDGISYLAVIAFELPGGRHAQLLLRMSLPLPDHGRNPDTVRSIELVVLPEGSASPLEAEVSRLIHAEISNRIAGAS